MKYNLIWLIYLVQYLTLRKGQGRLNSITKLTIL